MQIEHSEVAVDADSRQIEGNENNSQQIEDETMSNEQSDSGASKLEQLTRLRERVDRERTELVEAKKKLAERRKSVQGWLDTSVVPAMSQGQEEENIFVNDRVGQDDDDQRQVENESVLHSMRSRGERSKRSQSGNEIAVGVPVVKLTGVGKIPSIGGFGAFPAAMRLSKFQDWMELVESALSFVPDWSEINKAHWLKTAMGPELLQLIRAHKLRATDESRPFTSLVRNIEQHFKSLIDPAFNERTFQGCVQEAGETAGDFYVRLREVVRHSEHTEDQVRTKFIAGIQNAHVRETALTLNLSLEQVVEAAMRNEVFKMSEQKAQQREVNAVAAPGAFRRPQGQVSRDRSRVQPKFGGMQSKFGGERPKRLGDCKMCGFKVHRSNTCPAITRKCNKCQQVGHYASVCPKGGSNQVNQVMASADDGWGDL